MTSRYGLFFCYRIAAPSVPFQKNFAVRDTTFIHDKPDSLCDVLSGKQRLLY